MPRIKPRGAYKPVPDYLVNTGEIGIIYLIHFSEPFRHARHYLGWTTDLAERLWAHKIGRGSNLISHVNAAGIAWHVVRTYTGDRNLERRIKHSGGLGRCCNVCSPPAGDRLPRFWRLPFGDLSDITDPNLLVHTPLQPIPF